MSSTVVAVVAVAAFCLALLGPAAAAFADVPCTPVTTGANPASCPAYALCPARFADPANNLATAANAGLRDFSIEGKIIAIDQVLRAANVNGVVFRVPPSVTLDTGKLTSEPATTFDQLDPVTDIGSTLIVDGQVFRMTTAPYVGCVELRALTVFYEISENVIVGQITGVDLPNKVFFVDGAPIKMNTDPRFPRYLFNINAEVTNVITGTPVALPTQGQINNAIDVIPGVVGSIAGVEGYYRDNIFNAIVVETEAWPPITAPQGYTVVVSRYLLNNGRPRFVIDVVCNTAAICTGQRIELRIGTTTSNACSTVNPFFTSPVGPAPTLVNGKWDVNFALQPNNNFGNNPPRSVCVTARPTPTAAAVSALLTATFQR